MISNPAGRRAAQTLVVFVSSLVFGACGARSAPSPTPSARALPADSARMLELAISLARPAYATQEQALAAGAYRGATLASAAAPRPQVAAAGDRQPAPREPVRPDPAPSGRAAPAPAREPVRAVPRAEVPPGTTSSPVALLGEETAAAAAGEATRRAAGSGVPQPEPMPAGAIAGDTGADPGAIAPPPAERAAPPASPHAEGADQGRPAAASTTAFPAAPPQADTGMVPADERPAGDTRTRAALTPAGRFVVQIAAFRDRSSAERALSDAERLLPELRLSIEQESGVFRVVAGGWDDEAAARAGLPGIRDRYPSAWVRPGTVP